MVAMLGLGGIDQRGWRKGPWIPEEDKLLTEYVKLHGEGRWSSVARCTGLNRSGKSSRLRWVNYLRPGLKKGHLTPQEEGIIIELHSLWGNKWSTIARYLPGRTDNEIKNYWRTHFKKNPKTTSEKQFKQKAQILAQKMQPLQRQNVEDETKLQRVNILSGEDRKMQLAGEDVPLMNLKHPIIAEEEDQCLPVLPKSNNNNIKTNYNNNVNYVAFDWADINFTGDPDLLILDSLWSFDDQPRSQVDITSNHTKIATKNNAPSFTFGGDYNTNPYFGGYIY